METSFDFEQDLLDLLAFNFDVEHQAHNIGLTLTDASSTNIPQNPAPWSPTESAAAPAPPTSPNLHQCSHCHQPFKSKSNVNRHVKYDCVFGTRVKFSCRYAGCGKQFSRKAYRQQHERSSCQQRPGVGGSSNAASGITTITAASGETGKLR